MDTMEIKPCPFCGDDDPCWGGEEAEDGTDYPWLECQTCGAKGPIGVTHASAAAAWNIRY